MFGTSLRTVFLGIVSIALVGSSSRATTYVVDQNGGGQFLDIPPAIAAAQNGDVLLVMSGSYSPFTVDKKLTIIGYGNPSVNGTVTVANLSASQRAVIVGILPLGVSVSGCAAPVVMQDMGSIPTSFTVDTCNDVRLARTDVIASPTLPAPGPIAVTAEMARLEIVGGWITGYSYESVCECTVPGGIAVEARASSRIHLALVSATGGAGNFTSLVQAGNGAPALNVLALGEAIVAGGGTNGFYGGAPGLSIGHSDCYYDGSPASGATVQTSGVLRESGTVFVGSCCYPYFHCLPKVAASPIQGNEVHATPDDPTLRMTGAAAAGQTIQLIVRGQPGATALLYFGRQAIVQPDPNTTIELLTPKARLVHLGVLPPSGEKTFTWMIPVGAPPGTFLCTQAEITQVSGALERTNSMPIVVR